MTKLNVSADMKIMTGVEVIIANFWPEVRNMLPEIKHRGQHRSRATYYELREKLSIMIETPVAIRFVILQRLEAGFVVFYVFFE